MKNTFLSFIPYSNPQVGNILSPILQMQKLRFQVTELISRVASGGP